MHTVQSDQSRAERIGSQPPTFALNVSPFISNLAGVTAMAFLEFARNMLPSRILQARSLQIENDGCYTNLQSYSVGRLQCQSVSVSVSRCQQGVIDTMTYGLVLRLFMSDELWPD